MAREQKEYRRLPGMRFTAWALSPTGIPSSLWLGNDHLLCVIRRGFSEDYRRYYYRDIQAIITYPTARGRAINITLGLLAGMAVLTSTVISLPLGLILSGISLLLLAINLLRGPTCACHLRTAVHLEPLLSLGRLRAAHKAIGRLKPLIEQAQGGPLDPEQLDAKTTEMARAIHSDPGAPISPARASAQKSHYAGTAHKVLFSLLLVDVGHTCACLLFNNVALYYLGTVLTVVLLGSIIVALIKQRDTDMPRQLQRLVWGTLAYLVAYVLFSNTYYQFSSFPVVNNQWEYMTRAATLSPWDHPFLLGMMTISAVCSLLLGVFGFFLLRDVRQTHERVLPAVPETPEPPPGQEE